MVVPFDFAVFQDGFSGVDADDAINRVESWGLAAFDEGVVTLEAIDHQFVAVSLGIFANQFEIAHVGDDWSVNGHPDTDELGFSSADGLGVAVGLIADFFGSGANSSPCCFR